MLRVGLVAVAAVTSAALGGCVAFDPAQHHALGSEYGSGRALSVAFGDVDGNGMPNALVATGPRGSVTDQGGGGSLGYGSEILAGSPTKVVRTARFNADAIDDAAVLSDDGVAVYFGSAPAGGNNGGLHEDDKATIPTTGRSLLAVGDFTGDGKQDVAVDYNSGSGTVGVSVYPGDGAGGFGAAQNGTIGTGVFNCDAGMCLYGSVSALAAANVDGTGPDELVAAVTVLGFTGNRDVLELVTRSGGSFGVCPIAGPAVNSVTPFGVAYRGLALGALDAGASLDVAGVRSDGDVTLMKGAGLDCTGYTGFGTGGALTTVHPPAGPAAAFIGDLDGDGKGDLAVAARDAGKVALYSGKGDGTFVSGNGITSIDANVGPAPTDLAFGRIDGDTKPDLLVPNSTENYAQTTWLVNRSGPPFP